jgi:hypothetical protein
MESLSGAHRELMTVLRNQNTEEAAEQVGAILARVASAFDPQ